MVALSSEPVIATSPLKKSVRSSALAILSFAKVMSSPTATVASDASVITKSLLVTASNTIVDAPKVLPATDMSVSSTAPKSATSSANVTVIVFV